MVSRQDNHSFDILTAMYASDTIPLLKRAITHLESHLTAPTSIKAAAAQVGYSRYHFSRTFLAVTGITPVAYLRKRRLTEAALELATSSKRILDIALDYQFQSQEAFTRSFKQEFGVSPGFYRVQKRLRRPFNRITLGVTNLLYPGWGLDAAPRLLVPERQIVAALVVPYRRHRQWALHVQGVALMSTETTKIRPAHRQDLPALCRLYHELHAFTLQGAPDRLRALNEFDYFGPSWLSLTQAKLIDAVNIAIWVAEVNGEVVGLAEVYLREDEKSAQHITYRFGYLQSLVVSQAWRGFGIGRQLLTAAETWSRSQGGWLIQVATAPVAILVDALSCLLSGLVLTFIRQPEAAPVRHAEDGHFFQELSAGLRLLGKDQTLRAVTVATAIISFFNAALEAIALLYMTRTLALSAWWIGVIFGAGSVGFLVGALLSLYFVRRLGLGPTMIAGLFLLVLADFIFALAGGPQPFVIGLLIGVQICFGCGLTFYNVGQDTLRQTITPDHLLGRMSATLEFTVAALIPLGALTGGLLGEWIGLQPTLLLAVGGELLAVIWLLFSPVRRLRS